MEDIVFSTETLCSYLFMGMFCLFFPAGVFIYLRRRMGLSAVPALMGFVSYMVISWVRALFRASLLTEGLKGTPWKYCLTSALLSGVLEEAGRYICMRYFMVNYDRLNDAVSYGIGHGGCESILGVSMVLFGKFITGVRCNEIGAAEYMSRYGADAEQLRLLADTHFYDSFGRIVMEVSGGAVNIALSVLVYISLHYIGQKKQLGISMLIHTLLDFLPYLMVNTLVFGIFCLLPEPMLPFDILICFCVYKFYRRMEE